MLQKREEKSIQRIGLACYKFHPVTGENPTYG